LEAYKVKEPVSKFAASNGSTCTTTPWYAYQRDVLSYLGSVVLTGAVLLGGTVALWHTTALAAFYSIYICMVIFRGDGEGNKGGGGGGGEGGGKSDGGESGGKTKSEPLFDLASQKGGPDDVKGTHLSRPPPPINLAVLDRAQVGAMRWVMDEVGAVQVASSLPIA
jgi:hypothetical protein